LLFEPVDGRHAGQEPQKGTFAAEELRCRQPVWMGLVPLWNAGSLDDGQDVRNVTRRV
jgi:hypothetical protein